MCGFSNKMMRYQGENKKFGLLHLFLYILSKVLVPVCCLQCFVVNLCDGLIHSLGEVNKDLVSS